MPKDKPDVTDMDEQLKRMQDEMQAMMPKDFAGMANLMAHPAAAMAAGSAIGLAFAGQAFGLWAGMLSGSIEAAQKSFGHDPAGADPEAFRDAASPTARAKATARTVMADAERAAAHAADAAGSVTAAVARDAEATLRTAATVAAAIVAPAAMARPAQPDDLKAISGIGPKLEKVLNDLGIWTYGQIAAWGEAQVAWLDDHLGFSGRIGRDDWIGQARKLEG